LSMREYLEQHAQILVDPDFRIKAASLAIGLIGPALGNFMLQPAVICLLILWWMDLLYGSARAMKAGEWRPRRALWSAVKLAMYLCLLGLGDLLRWGLGGYAGAGIFAAFTSAILLTEASSVLLHAAETCPVEVGPVKILLHSLASISRTIKKNRTKNRKRFRDV